MNNRWTFEEESKLLKLVSSGKTYKELSGGFNRSENALELRVKKIVYENISNNKSPEKISELLSMPKDKVMQYYYSYKDHLEREQKMAGGNAIAVSEKSQSKLDTGLSKLDNLSRLSQNPTKPIKPIEFNNNNNNTNNNTNNKIGGSYTSDKLEKLEKLELQNKKMKLLLENHILKHKLAKLFKSKDKTMYNEAIKALLG
jgi:hypothetical protein